MAKSRARIFDSVIKSLWLVADLSRSKGYLDFSRCGYDEGRASSSSSVPVVVGLEGARLVEPHVLGLLVGELGEVRLEGREVQRGHELVHQLGHQIDVGLVPARGRVEQFCNECTINQ